MTCQQETQYSQQGYQSRTLVVKTCDAKPAVRRETAPQHSGTRRPPAPSPLQNLTRSGTRPWDASDKHHSNHNGMEAEIPTGSEARRFTSPWRRNGSPLQPLDPRPQHNGRPRESTHGTQNGRSERNVGEPTNFTTDAAEGRPRQSHSSRENRQAESRTTREKTRPQVGSWKGPTKQPRLHPHGTGDSSHHGRKGKWRHQHRPYRSGKDDRREPRVLTRVATSQTRS